METFLSIDDFKTRYNNADDKNSFLKKYRTIYEDETFANEQENGGHQQYLSLYNQAEKMKKYEKNKLLIDYEILEFINSELEKNDKKEIGEQPINNINGIDNNLLKYLSENFTSTDKRFNDLTKYNQIYRFLNEGRDYNIEHRAYKILINKLFGFEYLNREIKGQTQKHLTQLENLALNYNNSKK